MSDSTTSPAAAATAATQSSPYAQVPYSTLASQAIIESEIENKPGADRVSPIGQDQKATSIKPLARTSSHNYEHDAAQFRSFGGGNPGEPAGAGGQDKNHNRKKSFSMEDQKHLRYGYMMTPKDNKGFSEK